MTITAIDTNVFLYALNADAPESRTARELLESLGRDPDTVVSELVLVELYVLLRNPAVIGRPLDAKSAAKVVGSFRRHPHWRLVDHHPDVMTRVWEMAAVPGAARARIFDTRLGLGLVRHGVTRFFTRNTAHFLGCGFAELIDPFA